MIYKITYGFGGRNQGWSETHFCKNSSSNPVDLVGIIDVSAQKRADFLGSPFQITAVRIARYYDEINNVRAYGTYLIKAVYSATLPDLVKDAEPADVALIGQLTGNFAALNPAEFVKTTAQPFFGGPPDGAVSNAGIVNLAKNNVGDGFTAWMNYVKTTAVQFGWVTYKRRALIAVTGVTQEDDGTVSLAIAAASPITVDQDSPKVFRVSRFNRGKSPLNGPMLAWTPNANTVRSVAPIAFSTAQTGGKVRIYDATPSFIPYISGSLELITGQHDRGRPFGSPRGRQPARVRG
jgi:hypothetical protein